MATLATPTSITASTSTSITGNGSLQGDAHPEPPGIVALDAVVPLMNGTYPDPIVRFHVATANSYVVFGAREPTVNTATRPPTERMLYDSLAFGRWYSKLTLLNPVEGSDHASEILVVVT